MQNSLINVLGGVRYRGFGMCGNGCGAGQGKGELTTVPARPPPRLLGSMGRCRQSGHGNCRTMQTEKQVVLEENWQVLELFFHRSHSAFVSRACWPGSMSLGVFHSSHGLCCSRLYGQANGERIWDPEGANQSPPPHLPGARGVSGTVGILGFWRRNRSSVERRINNLGSGQGAD